MADPEIIDVLNEAGEVVGSISRAEAERHNHITKNVLIFIFSSQGRVWVQLRPMHKSHFPGQWDISACGSIQSGEAPDVAARRETHEETGLRVKLHHVETFLNVFIGENGEQRKRLSHLYVGVSDETPQINDEVDEFKDWLPSELKTDVKENPAIYVPSIITELDLATKGYETIFKTEVL